MSRGHRVGEPLLWHDLALGSDCSPSHAETRPFDHFCPCPSGQQSYPGAGHCMVPPCVDLLAASQVWAAPARAQGQRQPLATAPCPEHGFWSEGRAWRHLLARTKHTCHPRMHVGLQWPRVRRARWMPTTNRLGIKGSPCSPPSAWATSCARPQN